MATLTLQRRASFGWPSTSGGASANPTRGMAVHYEGGDTGIAGWTHDRCVAHWKATRRFHMGSSRGWSDIGYSFGVCPHRVLEGRGKDRSQAAQPGGNSTWYSCTFMTGPGEDPHPEQVNNFRLLRAWLMADDVASAIRPHSSFSSTSCPGNILRRMITDGTLVRGAVVPQPEPESGDEMRKGDDDNAVKIMQNRLNDYLELDPPLALDGDYGDNTADAVEKAQQRLGFARTPDIAHGMFQAALYLAHKGFNFADFEQLMTRSDNQNVRLLDQERMHYPEGKTNKTPHIPAVTQIEIPEGEFPPLPANFAIVGSIHGTLTPEVQE